VKESEVQERKSADVCEDECRKARMKESKSAVRQEKK
jgi:hypothetical protein